MTVLRDYMVEAELVPFDAVDARPGVLDDGKVLLALHHHERPWDGLITTDSSMIRLPREFSVLMQTGLKATGLSVGGRAGLPGPQEMAPAPISPGPGPRVRHGFEPRRR